MKFNSSPILPRDKDMLARVMHEHLAIEEQRQSIRFLRYQIAHAYLAGVRRFQFIDAMNKNIAGFYVDEDGKVPLQVPELLSHVNKMEGLIRSMNLWPNISRRGDSLETVRDSSMMQVTLDSLLSEDQQNKTLAQYAHLVSLLGTAGITGHLVDLPTVGLAGELEAIHPAELYPFPSVGYDVTKQRGLIWYRKLPVERLKKIYGGKITKNLNQMLIGRRRVSVPQTPDRPTMYAPIGMAPPTGPDNDGDSYMEARVWQLWTEGPGGTVERYCVGSGNYVIEDQDLSDELVYCPVGVGRFWDVGDFYGAGLFDACYPVIRDYEAMVKALVSNVKDWDRYPLTVIPAGALNEKVMKATGHSARFISIKMEPMLTGSGEFRPTVLQPANAGETPGRTAAYLADVISKKMPIRDILQEKGRVDSYQGLQYLEENSNASAVVPIANTVRAFSDCYRALGRDAIATLIRRPQQLRVAKLDLSLAGSIIDFDNGTFSLGANRIPDITRLSFGVKENSPRSKSLRKQEATEFLVQGIVTRNEYILLAMKEGWDPAIWMEGELAGYRTLVMNVLSTYGDGETPGKARWATPSTERPDLQIIVLNAFLASPECHVASAEVVDKLIAYRDNLLQIQGKMMPQGMPDPYETAQQEAMAQQEGGGQMQPSPTPPYNLPPNTGGGMMRGTMTTPQLNGAHR